MKEKNLESKTANQEGLQKWKEHFKNLLRNPSKNADKHNKEITISQLDIKLGQFMEQEFDIVLKKKTTKSQKAASLDKIFLEVWKTRRYNDILIMQCCVKIKHNRGMNKRLHPPIFQET